MRLSISILPPYLAARGLLDKFDNISSERISGKNNNFLVRVGRRNIFIKQYRSLGIDYELLCEIERYLFKKNPCHHCELISSDPINHISIYSRISGENLDRYLSRSDLSNARALAFEISRLMSTISTELMGFLQSIPKAPHWVVDLLSPPVEILRHTSPAQIQLLEFIQSDRMLSNILSLVKSSWSTDNVVHGDIKHQNILVQDGSAFVLDWEMIQAGPPQWDHAAATAAIFSSWIMSFPVRQLGLAAKVDEAKILTPCMNAMIKVMKEGVTRSEEHARMVSANLIKSAFEGAAGLEHIPQASIYMLQVAQNFTGELFD